MGRLAEINARLIEIRGLLQQEGADVDALETEINNLTAEKRTILENAQRRQRLLDSIAGDEGLDGAAPFNPLGNQGEEGDGSDSIIDSPEYRTAFLHMLQGRELTQAETRTMDAAQIEMRALSSAADSAGSAIPIQTHNMVIHKMIKIAPMLEEITLLQVPGNLSLVVESGVTDATKHTENEEASDAADKTISITLGGYEILKIVSISAKVQAMSISAFEDWLTTILSEGCVRKIEDWIINGTGTNEPTGVEKANTWANNTNQITFAAATPTYAEICALIALLPAEYDANAKFLMNKKTFWQKLQAIRDDGKAPIVKGDNGQYTCMGYPVLISAKVADNAMYLGDFKQYYGNLAAPITVAASSISGFRRNATDYRGTAIFDGKPAVANAFVKGVATTA